MLRALRQYLDDGEGREIEQDTESIAELDRGESVPFEEVLNRLRERVARAEAASKK
jgi:predicted transcriptional regulator